LHLRPPKFSFLFLFMLVMRFELSCISSRPIAPLSLRRLVSFKEEAGSFLSQDVLRDKLQPFGYRSPFSASPSSSFPTLPNNTCMTRRANPARNANLQLQMRRIVVDASTTEAHPRLLWNSSKPMRWIIPRTSIGEPIGEW
jgi:hypothetical protein